MWHEIMSRIVRWLDPKLDKYRVRKTPSPKQEPKYTPKTMEDFIGVIQRTPKFVLSSKDRVRIAAVMSFDDRKVTFSNEVQFSKKNEIKLDSNYFFDIARDIKSDIDDIKLTIKNIEKII